MKKFLLLTAVAGFAAMLTGCATQMSKSEYAVDVISSPMGQPFKIYNRKGEYIHQGVTPEIVVLPASSDYYVAEELTFKFGKDKSPNVHTLKATLSPWYWGNCFPIYWPGFFVDGVTGAMWALPKTTDLNKPQPAGQMNL